jgi:hypothetical protein
MDEIKLRAWLHEISGISGLLSCLSEAPDEDLTLDRVRRLTKTSAERLRALFEEGRTIVGETGI